MEAHDIARRRVALGLTQQELADLVGVHQVTLARWETGTRRPRGLSTSALSATLDMLEADAERRAARRRAYAVRATRQNDDTLE